MSGWTDTIIGYLGVVMALNKNKKKNLMETLKYAQ